MTTTNNPKPQPPALPVHVITAGQLQKGMIVTVRALGSRDATFKTVAEATPHEDALTIAVTFEDSTTTTWHVDVRLAVTAESLPASYWRTQYGQLRKAVDDQAQGWLRYATNISKPSPTHIDPPGVRQGRALQARRCAADVAVIIGVRAGA